MINIVKTKSDQANYEGHLFYLAWLFYHSLYKVIKMKPTIIKLNLAGTTVHVNTNNILYYYAKHTDEGKVVTELFFTEKFGLEVSETPAEIDALINRETKVWN